MRAFDPSFHKFIVTPIPIHIILSLEVPNHLANMPLFLCAPIRSKNLLGEVYFFTPNFVMVTFTSQTWCIVWPDIDSSMLIIFVYTIPACVLFDYSNFLLGYCYVRPCGKVSHPSQKWTSVSFGQTVCEREGQICWKFTHKVSNSWYSLIIKISCYVVFLCKKILRSMNFLCQSSLLILE